MTATCHADALYCFFFPRLNRFNMRCSRRRIRGTAVSLESTRVLTPGFSPTFMLLLKQYSTGVVTKSLL